MDLLDRLLGFDHWATARLLELSRDLTDARLDQPFDVGLGTLRTTFEHMIFNIDFWTGLMSGQPVTTERDRHPSIAVLIERHERAEAAFAAIARRARDERRLDDTFVDHFGYRQTFGGTTLHVALHNAEHRTEALHILGRLGVPDLPELYPQDWEHATQGL